MFVEYVSAVYWWSDVCRIRHCCLLVEYCLQNASLLFIGGVMFAEFVIAAYWWSDVCRIRHRCLLVD